MLGVCGGYQLLGHSYTIGEEEIEGVGLLDVRTVRDPGPRLIGNVAIEVSLDDETDPRVLAGFENHGGRTHLGADARPLGRVLKGHGNDGRSGYEGARQGTTIGTYLHGPLLPKNVVVRGLADRHARCSIDPSELSPLDDGLEHEAHRSARRAARGCSRVRGSA